MVQSFIDHVNDIAHKDFPRFERACELFHQGCTIREVAKSVGMAINTAMHVRRNCIEGGELSGLPPIKCPCGEPTGHRGWCSYRVSYSSKRQAFLKRWHTRSRFPLTVHLNPTSIDLT